MSPPKADTCALHGPADPSLAAATAFTVSSAAWISALLFLVFGIVACQVLVKMDFKQDSLLYPRTKAD